VNVELQSTTLKEALALIGEKYDLSFVVDEQAFKQDLEIADVEGQQIRLEKVKGIRLSTVLEKLLAGVPGGYLVRPDYIQITTPARVVAAMYGSVPQADEAAPGGRKRPRMPAVQTTFDRRPVDEALRELAETTGINVLLDSRRLGEKGRATVTANLYNVPMDTAVRLLANLADAKAVLADNVFLVSTSEHAARWQATTKASVAGRLPILPGMAAVQPVREPIQLNVENTGLKKVLQEISRQTGTNVVLDPQAGSQGEIAISLSLEGVSFETAVRLVAEMASLKFVMIDNVAWVTTEARAAKLEADLQRAAARLEAAMKAGLGGLGGVGLNQVGALGIGGGFGGALGLTGGATMGPAIPIRLGTVAPAAGQGAREPAKADARPKEAIRPASKNGVLIEKLNRRITVDKALEANVPLREALDFLTDRYQLPILVNREAFRADLQMADVEGQQVKLPGLKAVRLSTVLRLLAGRVDGGFLLKGDHIEITTRQRYRQTIWGTVESDEDEPASSRYLMPVVYATIEARPLDVALRELAEASGISVVLDGHRAGEKARALVTGRFANVPVDTAVELLADEADLTMVSLDNVAYVTTADNAQMMKVEQQKVNQRGLEGTGEGAGAAQ
jgi:hypothetical protein